MRQYRFSQIRRWILRAKRPKSHQLARTPRLTAAQVSRGDPGFYPLAPAAYSAASVPLLDSALLDAAVKSKGVVRPTHIPEMGCFVLRNPVCGGEGHLFLSGRLVRESLLTPDEWLQQNWNAPHEVPRFSEINPRSCSRPLIWFLSRDYQSYGHWWLDVLPRLYHLKQQHPEWFETHDLALPHDLPTWAQESLEQLIGVSSDRFVRFTARSRDFLAPPWALVPTMVHQSHHFHPAAGAFYEYAVAWSQKNATISRANDRLFVTRNQTRRARPLANAVAVEQLFSEAGYEIIAPESLSWSDQISLFSRAKIVAGEHGSAMKNLLFSSPGTIQIVLNLLNQNQATIAALRQQPCLIHPGVGFKLHPRDHPYRIDIESLKQSISWAEAHRC